MTLDREKSMKEGIEWTEVSPKTKLPEIIELLEINKKTKGVKELIKLLQKKRYQDLQIKIGMSGKDADGKLGKFTLEKLEEYIKSQKTKRSLFYNFLYNSETRASIEWTETSDKSKLSEIINLLKQVSSSEETKELYKLLLNRKYFEFQKVIGMSKEKCDGKLGKNTLSILKKYIEAFTQLPGKVVLERDKDSKGEYKVYSYIVKKGGQPQHIMREYMKQIGGNIEGIKITDNKGMEYPENKNFHANDKVFIKVPLFESVDDISEDTKEKIKIQEDYILKQKKDHKETLEEFNKQYPMGKDIEFSFGMPVYQYDDIDKTLASITTSQSIDPKKYEVVILLNRPHKDVALPISTQQKILQFKKDHPEYNICVFEKTFDFEKDEKGKYKINYGRIYKTLADTIVYRNTQRKNIKGMDATKIRNLIIKTGAADSTDKNPKYIENQLEKYSYQYGGKELVRMTGESMLPGNVCKAYPLVEILEFFQRYFDEEYAGGPLNRNVGVGTYKSWMYCDVNGFDGIRYPKGEDRDLIKRIKSRINDKKNSTKVTMYHDQGFVGAVDESCDRGIWGMVEKNIPYCDRYNDKEGDTASKEKNWNNFAIEHKGEEKFMVLELTTKNLKKNISAFYRQRINNVFTGDIHSNKYHGYTDPDTKKHVPGYLDLEGKTASNEERIQWIAENVINPIMDKILSKTDFMGLDNNDYEFQCNPMIENVSGKIRVKSGSVKIKFKDEAISKIMTIHERKIDSGYYDYRK